MLSVVKFVELVVAGLDFGEHGILFAGEHDCFVYYCTSNPCFGEHYGCTKPSTRFRYLV